MENKNIDKTKIRFNIMAIILIAIFCFAVTPVTFQNDTFYTIKIGEHIIQNGIDMQDSFSYHNLEYTYPHWLYDVGIYLIYSIGGLIRSICIYYSSFNYLRYNIIYNECKINQKQRNIFYNNNRFNISFKRLYSSKSTTCYFHFICTYCIFY